ncbi:hypothetical protein AN219_38115 [Streptomyces nanshensis]|nr:hypothetical protein AN219_38115 [Streptomyces nanshensis]
MRQPLRADQQHVHGPFGDLGLDRLPVLRVRGIDGAGADTGARSRGHLIPHQGEQRRDNDGGSLPGRPEQRGRDEVDGRLAPSGALDHKSPPPLGDQRLDGPPLVVAQPCLARVVADEAGENSIGLEAQFRVVHGLHATGCGTPGPMSLWKTDLQ